MPNSNNKILNLADLNNKAKFKNIFTSDETEYTHLFKSNNPDVDAPLLWPNNWGETSPLNLIWLLFNTDNDTSFGICFHIDGEGTNAPGGSFLSAMDSAVFNTIKNPNNELFEISSSDKLNTGDINYRFGKNKTLQLFPNVTVNSSYTRSGKDYWFRLCLHDWNWEQLAPAPANPHRGSCIPVQWSWLHVPFSTPSRSMRHPPEFPVHRTPPDQYAGHRSQLP